MTVALNQNVNVNMFVDEVQQQFQPNVKDIQALMRVKNCQGAKTVQFPLMGAAISQERTSVQTPIPLANVNTTVPQVTVKRYTVADMTDIFDKATVPYDERQELAKSFALSLKRRLLQIVIDALNAASISKTVAANVSGSSVGLTLAALRSTAKQLDLDGVIPEGRTLLAHTNGMHHLTKDTQVTSSDWNTMRVLMTGKVDGYYGLNTFWVPNMPEGGLRVGSPLSAGIRANYAFQHDALGLAVGMEPKIEVNFVPTHGAWMITGYLMANALVIDPLGVVQVQTDTTVEDA